MRDKFLKVMTATPEIVVADTEKNTDQIIKMMELATEKKAKLLVLPELCITGYTCGDLFLHEVLLRNALEGLKRIVVDSNEKDMITVVGLPMMKDNKLYNVAAVVYRGAILGIVPKKNVPNYSEFYEIRYFAFGNEEPELLIVNGQKVPFGTNLIFKCEECPLFSLSVEICEDVWVPIPPSSYHCQNGAIIIANLSASNETTGKAHYRRQLIKSHSARTVCAYLYANAGDGESTTDVVYAGQNMIAENGTILSESKRFQVGSDLQWTEIDLGRIEAERRRIMTYVNDSKSTYQTISFSMKSINFEKDNLITLTRSIDKAPFVPSNLTEREERCEEILNIQAMGLRKRLKHTGSKTAVIGISGGLDSTLALLVTVKAFDSLNLCRQDIIAITMPCFGTTDRTYQNACSLVKELGATLKEINIKEAVTIHFRDIEHDPSNHDITYENAQARERTQILMNVANQMNGLVIGTGDMSELALGWATYNGDHMSMYGVNAGVPKTLVRYLVAYYMDAAANGTLKKVLQDILDTPVSPELLPPQDGEIAQRTEDIVGPYELHDFFLYYVMRFGYGPRKVYRLACCAFDGMYDNAIIWKWLDVFFRRFFSQQFKRSCLPDGPKVGSVALSPRGDLRMPSDASVGLWKNELMVIKSELEP